MLKMNLKAVASGFAALALTMVLSGKARAPCACAWTAR